MLDVFFRELQYPWWEVPYPENYLRHPKEASMYAQDQLDLGRLIVNIGGRVDYALSGAIGWSDPKDPTSPIENASYKLQFSPRLGFGYRITESTTFHFNYGHFFQIPEYRNLYLGSTLDLRSSDIFGNPMLQAQKTIGYEFGARQQLGDMWTVDVTAWTKSLTGQAGSINIMGFDPDSLGAYNYYIFDNYDYGSAKGVDITVEKRFSENYGGSLNYTYSVAKANRYYSWTGYWNGETDETEPKREMLMEYDQTHKLYAIVYFRFGEQYGPTVLGMWPLENWFVNFVVSYQSGYPYTPVIGSLAGDPMSARSPARFQIDMTIRKEFSIFGSSTLGIFARIYNLLDKKNILYVYPATGSPTQPDPTAGGYSTEYDRPDFYDTRRQIDLGVRIDF
jgi:outer membrane receptor protein involved in Fe transport